PDNLFDAKLGPLAFNGGPTPTHALLINSPAIDTGDNPFGLTTDQRGYAREVGTGADIGAYEWQGTPAKVNSVVINNGNLQRSRVTTVVVNFSAPVTFVGTPSSALQLRRQSDNAAVNVNVVLNGTGTAATLTFIGGAV